MTDILDRIDADVAAWEARPESWLPGDPLYDRPDGWDLDALTVRPMFQVVDDWAPPPRCRPCQVTWSGDAGCWMCGEERPALGPFDQAIGIRALLARMDQLDESGNRISPRPPPRFISPTPPGFAGMIRAAADMEQATARLRAAVEDARIYSESLSQLYYAHLMPPRPLVAPLLTGPSPLAVDGHAYRRRTRRRTRR